MITEFLKKYKRSMCPVELLLTCKTEQPGSALGNCHSNISVPEVTWEKMGRESTCSACIVCKILGQYNWWSPSKSNPLLKNALAKATVRSLAASLLALPMQVFFSHWFCKPLLLGELVEPQPTLKKCLKRKIFDWCKKTQIYTVASSIKGTILWMDMPLVKGIIDNNIGINIEA